MSAQYKEIISEPEFFRASYAMVVLASAIMLVRIGVQVWRRKAMELQDYLIYLAFALFLALSICYLVNISTIFDISKVLVGSLEPWPTFQSDFVLNVRIVFVTTVLFWLTLWSVKLSLLALYKRLLEGLPRVWTRLWWAVFTFCIVSVLGCIASYLTSCPDFTALVARGDCPNTPRNIRAQLVSLYMSYAVDILSDLMIMFLPIRLVWNLQMVRAQKIAIIALFASGFVCITFATLRVIQVGRKSGESTAPSPTWLAFWTLIESSVAICIGCCPAFAVFFRRAYTPSISYDTNGYVRHSQSGSGADQDNAGTIKMNAVTTGSSRDRTSRRDTHWNVTRSSEEDFAADNKTSLDWLPPRRKFDTPSEMDTLPPRNPRALTNMSPT